MRTMLLLASVAVVSAQGTIRPGDIPRPDVWIKNAPNEPVPIDLREVHVDRPISVLLMNGETSSAAASGSPLRVRVVPPTWAYRAIAIDPAASDPAAALQAAGTDGWETTGVSWIRGQQTVVLMKRPR